MMVFTPTFTLDNVYSCQNYSNTIENIVYHCQEISSGDALKEACYMIPLKNREIEMVGSYGNDWDSYGSPGPNETAIEMAQYAQKLLIGRRFFNYHISPAADGGIGFTFMNAGKVADIVFYNDGTIDAGFYPEAGDAESWEVEKENSSILSTFDRIKEYLDLQSS